MNNLKTLASLALLILGILFFVYGEYDDSPGGQLLGLILAIIGFVEIVKNIRRPSE